MIVVLYAWRPIRLGWDDVVTLREDAGPLLETRQGDFVLGDGIPKAAELRCGLRRLLALRADGAVLPRLRDAVPEGALSRAELALGAASSLSRSPAPQPETTDQAERTCFRGDQP